MCTDTMRSTEMETKSLHGDAQVTFHRSMKPVNWQGDDVFFITDNYESKSDGLLSLYQEHN